MSQQKTPSTRTKVTSMVIMGSTTRVVTTTSKGSSLARNIHYISNAPRPDLFSYSNLNHSRAECYNEKLPTLQKSRDSASIAARHQERTHQAPHVEFVQQDRPLGSVSVTGRHQVFPKLNSNGPDYQPFLSFHPYSYFNIASHFSPDDRANCQSSGPGYDTSGYHHHPRGSTYYCNTYRLDEVHQVPPRSHQGQSEPKACASSSTRNESSDKVDHTYRDFSGVPPSTEDLKRYENKIEECTRRKNKGKGEEPASSKNSSSTVPPSRRQRKADALVARRGRGNRASQNGENAFVGFMGTNFPARLHDLLSHEDDVGDIISWLPHGRSWVVRDKAAFLEKVAPTHFQISKFESFTRQVNGWGFKRITQGPDINSYYHELFLRGMPHLIQWMKRVSSTAGGAGKRRLRADPSEEPNFYDISEKYPIPDYYNRNGGRPLSLPTSMKSSFNKLLGGDDDNKDHGKKQLSTRRPLDNSCKTEETSKKNTTVSKQQQENPPSQELDASEFNCCNSSASSSSMVIASSTKKEQCDPTDFEDHVLHDHRAFYQMPMLSPACLSSPPKIIDNLPNLENSQHSSLKDVTSEEFWTRSDAAPYLDPRPVFRTTVHGEEESDLYDAMIAPAVSNEESSESCTNYLLPTNNQWQSICDLLLEDEDLDQESSDIRTSKGSWKKATTV